MHNEPKNNEKLFVRYEQRFLIKFSAFGVEAAKN